MASLDYARYYMDTYGQEDYAKLIDTAEKWRSKINKLKKIKILSQNDIKKYGKYDIDKSRYLIVLSKGYSGHKLLDYFRKKKIQSEMSFSRGVVLILSPFNTEEDFKKIYDALSELNFEEIRCIDDSVYYTGTPEKILEPYEAFKLPYEILDINKCEGKVSKEFIIPYPPGIPLICPGEKISKEALSVINEYINNRKDILGVDKEGKKIKIVIK